MYYISCICTTLSAWHEDFFYTILARLFKDKHEVEVCCDTFNMGMKCSFVTVFDQLFLKKSNKLDFEENRWLNQVSRIKKTLSRPSMNSNLWPREQRVSTLPLLPNRLSIMGWLSGWIKYIYNYNTYQI